VIEFEEVSFAYAGRPVLRGVSFRFAAAERIAVFGGSGQGKTTILRLILGLLRPDAGRVRVDGVDLADLDEAALREVRTRFTLVFQEGALFDSLDVKENVAFLLRERERLDEATLDARVRQLLRFVDLEPALHLMPEELSGGMHRRVAIARALAASDPAMFLYDEPTSGLDPVSALAIRRLILRLAQVGRGFVMVSHAVHDALAIADRFLMLGAGRLLFDGSRRELLEAAAPEVQAFLTYLRAPDAEPADLEETCLEETCLEETCLEETCLEETCLEETCLEAGRR